MIDLRTLQRALGGEITGGQVVCPGPGHGRRDRSLAVRPLPGGDGFLVHSFAGDDFRDCDTYVRERLGWPQWRPGDGQDRRVRLSHVKDFDRTVIDAEAERRVRTEDDLARIENAQLLWSEAVNPHCTAVEQYLQARRLKLGDDLAVLRFHPRTPWRNEDTGETEFIACMIAAFCSIDDGIVTAVHRIRVDQPERWPKTQRRMLGVVHRAAVMLDAVGSTLAIGEGVETCMAARMLGHKPAWALGSVGAIAGFPVLVGVEQLHILGEAGEASARATEMCGRRWYRAERKVRLILPDVGSDLNDELMATMA
jgi:putative DNA primase/helicase